MTDYFCGMIRSGKLFFPITEDENSYLELVIFFVECINDGLLRCGGLNFLCSSNKTAKCKLKLACKTFCAIVHNLTNLVILCGKQGFKCRIIGLHYF